MGPRVSIVTVSYNAAQCIAETIESVLAQTYTDYEYIFIDGQSTDETVSIIESYRSAFEAKGIPYLVVTEKDAGIYDAMNKSVTRACGQWVQMLNAGDYLADENVLANVFAECLETADILYGDTVLHDGDYFKLAKAGDLETIIANMPFCHQSIFVKRRILQQYGFNTKYRYAADYDQLLHAYLEHKIFQYIQRPIAVYDTSGESDKFFKITVKEQKFIRESHGITQKKSTKAVFWARMRAKIVKRLMPTVARSKTRGWYRSVYDVMEHAGN